MSTDLSGKIILFEEVLFCSDILKNELSPYNVNLSAHLNCTAPSVEFEKVLPIIKNIQDVYRAQVLLKEQARFYIKIPFGTYRIYTRQHPVLHQDNQGPDQNTYIAFKKLLNSQYKSERTVQYYALELAITSKAKCPK
jgi:AraC family transcriptional activator of pobA